jgi:hypothetical protein
MVEQHELSRISASRASARPGTMLDNDEDEHSITTSRLHRRTLLKLDTLLLPFLALLFLFNSLDKSNVSFAYRPSSAELTNTTTDWQCRVRTLHD